MARTIEGRTGQDVYVEVLETIRRHGQRRSSRNGPVLNLEDVTIVLESPYHALPLGTGRQLNRKIAAVEAMQLIGGFSDPKWAAEHAPNLTRWLEPSGHFWGGYGHRIGEQLGDVYDKLTEDPSTRQAVITLWDPDLDNQPGKLDYPCTIGIGFSIVRDHLNMRVVMRSNDAWLGLPYDMFQFGQLQLTLCNLLDLEPGSYVHNAWSLHLYEEHHEVSYRVTDHVKPANFTSVHEEQPTGFGNDTRGVGVELLRDRIYHLAMGDPKVHPFDNERWYTDVLHGQTYVGGDQDPDGADAGNAEPVHA